MTLKDGKINGSYIIEETLNDENVRKRLNQIGVNRGVKVKIVRFAPIGKSPIMIFVKGFYLAVRLKEAEKIVVRELNE